MSLTSDERHSLERIEAALRRTDPALAALHDGFTRRARARNMARRTLAWGDDRSQRIVRPVVAGLLAVLLVLAIFGAVHGHSRVRWPPGHCSPRLPTARCHFGAGLWSGGAAKTGAGQHG